MKTTEILEEFIRKATNLFISKLTHRVIIQKLNELLVIENAN
jgi:hypothetical protein